MAAGISDKVREIAESRGRPEPEVFERTLDRPCETRDLTQYLDGELGRAEALEHAGRGTG